MKCSFFLIFLETFYDFLQHKNIPDLYIYFKKRLQKCGQFCDHQKISSYPKKEFIFLKNPNFEIQNVEPPKNDLSLRMYENIGVPHAPLGSITSLL